MSRLFTRDFLHEVGMNHISGVRIMRGLGRRTNVGTTASGEDITALNDLSATPAAPASTILIPRPPDAGEQMTIISESANDTSAGTGARTVAITYVDASGNEQIEVVTMNGLTGVNTVATNIRFIQDLQVRTAGSGGLAAGNIRIFAQTNNTLVYSMISANENQSLVPHRMIPLGKTLVLRKLYASETKAKRMLVAVMADSDNQTPPLRIPSVFLHKTIIGTSGHQAQVELAYTIPALSVIKVVAYADAVGGEVTCHWWGFLTDD